jgi:hypothetical protein
LAALTLLPRLAKKQWRRYQLLHHLHHHSGHAPAQA